MPTVAALSHYEDLIAEARAALQSDGALARAAAEDALSQARPLTKAIAAFEARFIQVRVGVNTASQGDNRWRYYSGEGPPPAGSEYDEDAWELLKPDEARADVEADAGVALDDLTATVKTAYEPNQARGSSCTRRTRG
jgi:hypothetical protein